MHWYATKATKVDSRGKKFLTSLYNNVPNKSSHEHEKIFYLILCFIRKFGCIPRAYRRLS